MKPIFCVFGHMLACLYLDEDVVDLCISMYINFAPQNLKTKATPGGCGCIQAALWPFRGSSDSRRLILQEPAPTPCTLRGLWDSAGRNHWYMLHTLDSLWYKEMLPLNNNPDWCWEQPEDMFEGSLLIVMTFMTGWTGFVRGARDSSHSSGLASPTQVLSLKYCLRSEGLHDF